MAFFNSKLLVYWRVQKGVGCEVGETGLRSTAAGTTQPLSYARSTRRRWRLSDNLIPGDVQKKTSETRDQHVLYIRIS